MLSADDDLWPHKRLKLDNGCVDNDVDLASQWSDGPLGPFAWEDNAADMPSNPVLHKRGISSFCIPISFAETPPDMNASDSLSFVTCVNLHRDTYTHYSHRLAPRSPGTPSGFHTVTNTHTTHSSTYNFHPTLPWFGREHSLQHFHPLYMTDGIQGYTSCIGVNFDKQRRRKGSPELVREFRK